MADIVSGDPCPDDPTSPGKVIITDGATGDILFEIIGDEPGDQFGKAIAYGGDLDRDGRMELLVGGPGLGYVFAIRVPGPMPGDPDCPVILGEYAASQIATYKFTTDSEELFDVGYDVAAGYDFREDGYPTFRFTARYEMDNGDIGTREYIVHGYTGLFLARVERYIQTEGVAREPGDARRDGQVDEKDSDRVIENYGSDGENVTADEGDVNNDQYVGPNDFVTTMNQQGKRMYDPTSDTPPADFDNVQNEGCDSYYARGDGGQWYHIELFGLGCVGPVGAAAQAAPEDCLEEKLEECEGDEGVDNALELIEDRCGTSAENLDNLTVYCIECDDPPDDFDQPIPPGNDYGRTISEPSGEIIIVICTDRVDPDGAYDLCSALAHELIHASQHCYFGMPNNYCHAHDHLNNDCNFICGEMEAFGESGQCDALGFTATECCEAICDVYTTWWCEEDCEEFCSSVDECCSNGQHHCGDDHDCNPYYEDPCDGNDDGGGGSP